MSMAQRVHDAVAKVAPGLVGVSVGVDTDKSTWVLQFSDATLQERAAAQAVVDAFDPAAPEVPRSVTRLQARLALQAAGVLSQVSAAMSALPETSEARLYWDNASTWERSNPILIQMAQEFGLAASLDAIFLDAHQR